MKTNENKPQISWLFLSILLYKIVQYLDDILSLLRKSTNQQNKCQWTIRATAHIFIKFLNYRVTLFLSPDDRCIWIILWRFFPWIIALFLKKNDTFVEYNENIPDFDMTTINKQKSTYNKRRNDLLSIFVYFMHFKVEIRTKENMPKFVAQNSSTKRNKDIM